MKTPKLNFLFILLFFIACSDDDSTSTCIDGIQNGTELGIDCGGDCPPCPVLGCTDPNAHNYNPNATQDDDSCETCDDGIQNGTETGVDCGGDCTPCQFLGCTDPNAHNYNPNATQDDDSCETCDDGIFNGDEEGIDCGGVRCNSCPTLGDDGPAGGLIFYDKGSYSNGWRYLEFGQEIQGGDKNWGCLTTNNTSFSLGRGYENTINVINNYNNNNCSESPQAFLACAGLQRNGFDDWFLPSANELQELYQYRNQLALGAKRYWSSTESTAQIAYIVDYGGNDNGIPHTYTWRKTPNNNGDQGTGTVVAIRRF